MNVILSHISSLKAVLLDELCVFINVCCMYAFLYVCVKLNFVKSFMCVYIQHDIVELFYIVGNPTMYIYSQCFHTVGSIGHTSSHTKGSGIIFLKLYPSPLCHFDSFKSMSFWVCIHNLKTSHNVDFYLAMTPQCTYQRPHSHTHTGKGLQPWTFFRQEFYTQPWTCTPGFLQ